MGRRSNGQPFTSRMPRRKVVPLFGAGIIARGGFEELGSLLVRRRDRFLRELMPVVVDWFCERILSDQYRSRIIGTSATAPGGPALWPSGHEGPVQGSSAPDLFGGEALRRPSGAGPSGSMPSGVDSSGGCYRSFPSRHFGGFAANETRWSTGLSVPRVVRSSERSTRLPTSFVGCVLFPHGSILWTSVLLRIQLRLVARLGNPVLRCCSSGQDRGCRLGTVRGSALRSRREVGRTFVLRDGREVSRVFVLRGGHEVSNNCPFGGGRSARRPFALRSGREV